jgi:hypothetical protein
VHNDPVAAAVAAAVARRDPERLAAMLTETARLRALLPGSATVAHGRSDVAAGFLGWFADFDTADVLESAGEAVADRLLIHYRLGLSRAKTRWVCTQTAVCKVVEGRLAVIDLLCSGFREVSSDDHVTALSRPPSRPPSRARLVGRLRPGRPVPAVRTGAVRCSGARGHARRRPPRVAGRGP